MDKKHLVLNKLISSGFILYFLILFVERLLAVCLSINGGDSAYQLTNGKPMAIVYYVITCASLLAGIILFIKPLIKLFKPLFGKDTFDFNKENNKELTLATIVLLVGGMMHTAWTNSGIQFTAYGFLIMSLICFCIQHCFDNKKNAENIISVIYLVCFSMAIPVAYLYFGNNNAQGVSFYIFTLLAVAALIPAFGKLMLQLMDEGAVSKSICPVAVMVVLDALVIGLNRSNVFVLSAAIATLLAYIVYVIATKQDAKQDTQQ